MKHNLLNWLFFVVVWLLVMLLYAAVAQSNINMFISISGLEELAINNPMVKYLASGYQYLEASLAGIFFGSLFFLIHRLSEHPLLQKRSFLFIILVKSLLYLGSIFLSGFLIFSSLQWLGVIPDGLQEKFTLSIVPLSFYLISIGFILLAILLFNFFLELSRKIGPVNLWPILTGKYHQPQQEERIFMFLDLRSSTYYAEKLGHMKYSKLIQDCFRDLSQMMNQHQLNIYQYLGDGVILTWPLEQGQNVPACVEVFFHFLQRINHRRDYYHQRYGLVPEFKAGLHAGKVTAAEIGNYRREIAYHGDVVNTAARIQDLCNQYDRNLLVSENLSGQIVATNGYHVDLIDSVKLKGKTKDVKIYAVSHHKVVVEEVGEAV